MRVLLATMTGLGLLVLGGCGGSGASDQQQAVRALVDSYETALAHGNYGRACDESAHAVQAAIVTTVRQIVPAVTSCPAAVGAVVTAAHVDLTKVFAGVKVGAVQIKGDQATINGTAANNQRFQATAVRENGAWKIGESTSSGGIFSAFTEKEGSAGTTHSGEIKKYEQLAKREPSSAAAWEKLLQAQLHEAGNEAYVSRTGGVTSQGKELYARIASSWRHYLALNPPNPSVPLAKEVLLVFGEEGLNEPAAAVQVLQIIVAAEPNSTHYYSFLADYAYKAHNTRVGDLAAEKAVALAPAAQRQRLKTELEALKNYPSGTSETAVATK